MPAVVVPGASSAPELDGHLAVPPVGGGPWPGVVVIHELFGLNDDIRQQADRLAAAGYLALAPDLFTAGGAIRCLRSTFKALMSGSGPAYGDIEASRLFLAGHQDCTGKVGVIGFCMGGGFALMTATRGFDASSSNYGMPPKDPAEVLRGACPIVGSYGAKDRGLRGVAGKLDQVLTEVGVEHDMKEYPGVGHSFMNRHNVGPARVLEKVGGFAYDHPSAEDSWRRILRFFDTHLREEGPERSSVPGT